MIRSVLRKLLAKRFAFHMVVVVAIFILCINEYGYRTSMAAFRNGTALTDHRVSTARLLQALTDAQSSQRNFLLTQNALDLALHEKAVGDIAVLRVSVVPFLNAYAKLSESDINAFIDSVLSEQSTTLSLSNRNTNPLALDNVKEGAGTQRMGEFRQLVDGVLTNAEVRQSSARARHVESKAINHAADILLILGAIAGVYLYMRQLRARIAERQTAHDKLEVMVEKRTAELRDLTRHLQTVREDEKDHLARELHDQLGGLLTVAKLDLEGMRKRVTDMPDLSARLQRLGSRINEVIALKRRMVEDMRPSSLTMLGLRTTLEQHCRDMAESMNIPIEFSIDDIKAASATELVIFRFVQEALTNMAKHANAKNVSVSLHKSGSLINIVVSDNGTGFDVDRALAAHHGLTGMRYRIDSVGGVMTVDSKPGMGTTVRATIGL